MIFSRLTPMGARCSEPLLGIIVLGVSVSTTCSSMWLEPSLGSNLVSRLLARLPLIVALCLPLKAGSPIVGDRSCASMEASKAEGKRLTDGGPNMAIGQEGHGLVTYRWSLACGSGFQWLGHGGSLSS